MDNNVDSNANNDEDQVEAKCINTSNIAPTKYRPKRSKPGFHSQMFEETSYYLKDGLQFVYPYRFTFTAHVKQRWLNLAVIDLFRKEFHLETMEYYERAIKTGKIKVNNKTVCAERLLTHNDILQTTVHRHEPPVIHQRIEFIANDDQVVVINKPSSIPVHPCGRYRHNTVAFILGKEYNLHGLHTIHRIDRLTSGILIFAKTKDKSKELEKQIHTLKNIEKEYVARVVGKFPREEVVVDQPILTLSHKIGVCEVHADGKPCVTKFQLLSFNGESSVVSCKPLTGRMHQIRVHLQWLGFPIVNDPIYNHPTAWTSELGRKRKMDEVIAELLNTRKDKSYDFDLSTDKVASRNSEDTNKAENEVSSCKRIKIDVASNKNLTNEKKNGNNKDDNKDNNNDDEKHNSSDNKDDDDDNEKGNSHNKETEEETEALPSGKNKVKLSNDDKCVDTVTGDTKIQEVSGERNVSDAVSSSDDHILYTSRDIGEEYVDEDCSDCKRKWQQPFKSELVMYLHSLRYKGPDWEYRTSEPEWAKEDWNDD